MELDALIRVYHAAIPPRLCQELVTGFEALDAEHLARSGDTGPRFTELNLTHTLAVSIAALAVPLPARI